MQSSSGLVGLMVSNRTSCWVRVTGSTLIASPPFRRSRSTPRASAGPLAARRRCRTSPPAPWPGRTRGVAMPSVWCTFCSTRKTVTPAGWIRRSTAKVSCTSRGDSRARARPPDSSRGRTSGPVRWTPWPARRRTWYPPAATAGWRELGEGGEHALEPPGHDLRAAARHGPRPEIFQDREAREDPAPSGMQPMPRRTMRWVGRRVSSVPRKAIRPATGRSEPEDGADEGGLPRAVRAQQTGDGPWLDVERDVLQHVRPVVAGEHVVDDQRLVRTRHVSPRYARRTSGSADTSAKVPSQSFFP